MCIRDRYNGRAFIEPQESPHSSEKCQSPSCTFRNFDTIFLFSSAVKRLSSASTGLLGALCSSLGGGGSSSGGDSSSGERTRCLLVTAAAAGAVLFVTTLAVAAVWRGG